MKRLFMLWLACLAILTVSAGPVSQQQARKLAESFLQKKGVQVRSEAARARGGRTATGEQTLYVFNTVGDRGFVIVSGDDRVESILGYTTHGSFDEATLPENFRAWLEQTSAEIEALAKQSQQPVTSTTEVAPAPRQVAIHPAVSPLIITEWNQGNTDNVYNAHLPKVGGKSPCTGCVATAGAQIMYYYRWPQAPTQVVPGYTLERAHGADTSGDLPSFTFQWDKMKTKYSYREETAPLTEAEEAVADLMLYCGYAAQMNFGTAEDHGGSSASTSTLADGMCKYFDYNPDTWKVVDRSNYSIADWDELIYNELASGRPIIYSGSFAGGHAFICDGYDGAGLYHFNWGWGGGYDGFFKLQATNPYGKTNIRNMGYIADHYCVIGLQPNSWPVNTVSIENDEWETPEIEGLVATASNIRVQDMIVVMRLGNDNEDAVAFGYGIGELNGDGSISVISTENERYKEWGELSKGWFYSDVSFDFSAYELSEGSHTLVPISLVNGETEWKRCRPADVYFEVTVSGGAKTVVGHPVENLQIKGFDLATGGIPGYYQSVNFTVTNHGDNIEKTLYIYRGTADDLGDRVASKTIKIASGNTKTYNVSIGKLEAGTYTISLAGERGGNVLAKKEVTITQDLSATSFDVTGVKFANSELEVDVTVENHAGDYAYPLFLFASKTNSMDFVYAAGSAIERGSSEVVKFYFKPTETGTWNLWVATDYEGTNVIGQTQIEIEEAPTGKVSLKSSNQNAIFGKDNVTYSFTVQNIGDVANYHDIETWLWVYDDSGSGTTSSDTRKITPLVLQPGEEKTVTVSYSGLEEGVKYGLSTYCYESFDSSSMIQFDRYRFTFVKPSGDGTPGDADGNGKVDANDVKVLINYMNGSGTINMDSADLDGDNKITIADIIKLVNLILSK